MFLDVFFAVQKCSELADSPINRTEIYKGETKRIYCRQPGNFTLSDLDKHIQSLQIMQWFFLIFAVIGTSLYFAHMCILLPNLCKHCRDPEFEHELDSPHTSRYYRNIVHTHTVFMLLETLIHDIPASCLAVELSLHYFVPAQINCWECALSAGLIPAELSLQRGSLWIGLKISAVGLISIYKGKRLWSEWGNQRMRFSQKIRYWIRILPTQSEISHPWLEGVHRRSINQSIQFWSGFIPVNGNGRISIEERMESPTKLKKFHKAEIDFGCDSWSDCLNIAILNNLAILTFWSSLSWPDLKSIQLSCLVNW